jgi:hypothetical protein
MINNRKKAMIRNSRRKKKLSENRGWCDPAVSLL